MTDDGELPASSSEQLDDRVALITGSTSGIGAATARLLAAHGAKVVVNSRSSVDEGRALAEEIGGAYVQADVSDPDRAAEAVTAAAQTFGGLDILVNNAGTTEFIAFDDLDTVTADVWHRILDANVIGTWMVTRAAVPYLRDRGEGVVVNVGSVAGIRQTGSSIPYGVSKAAVHHMTEMLAVTLGPAVRVNAVAPGLIETPWTERWPAEAFEQYARRSPTGRWAQPSEVADVIVALVTSRSVNGQVVVVDGGHSLRN